METETPNQNVTPPTPTGALPQSLQPVAPMGTVPPPAPTPPTPSPAAADVPPPNAKASKKSLYLILAIIVLIVIFSAISLILFSQKNSSQTTPTSITQQESPAPSQITPSVQPTQDPETELNSLDMGNPNSSLNSIQQNVDQL